MERYQNESSAYLAMEMRLGKTLVAIHLMERWKARKVLVLAPKTVLLSWADELKEEGQQFIDLTPFNVITRAQIVHGIIPKNKNTPFYMLLNYEAFTKVQKTIDVEDCTDAIICDESTAIKNPKAGITKALKNICHCIKYKICLSGLPTPKSWLDIYEQCAFLQNGYFMGRSNFYKWRDQCFTKDYNGFSYFLSGKQASAVKKAYQQQAFILSRKEAGIGEEKIYSRRIVDLTPERRKIYNYILRHWQYPAPDQDKFSTKYVVAVLTYLRQFVADEKYQELYKVVEELQQQDNNASMVIWCSFNDEINTIKNKLKNKAITLTGDMSMVERSKALQCFQSGEIKVIIAQQALGKFGLRLDRADTAIYFSTSYNYEERAQSEDRIVRVGKKSPLYYIDIVSKNTIEEDIYENLRGKHVDAKYLLSKIRLSKHKVD